MAGPSPPARGALWASEDGCETPPEHTNWGLTRSVVVASLPAFVLLSLGHYFSVTLLFVHSAVQKFHLRNIGSEHVWVFEDPIADAGVFVWTEVSIAAISSAMLCLSWASTLSASAAVNSGGRLTPGELFSKIRGVLWGEPSITRTYSMALFLGHTLSLILAVFVVVLTSGGEMNNRVLRFLFCFLALLLFFYLAVVVSVDSGAFPLGDDGSGVPALWRVPALMDERVLQGFLVFFLSLVVTHGFLVGNGLWRDDLYRVEMTAVELAPGPVLTSTVWMVGACGLFGYAGVLLQV